MSQPLKKARRQDPTQRYRKGNQLGEGTFGIVYEAFDIENSNTKVAVKQIKQGKFEDGVSLVVPSARKLVN
jgi:serine/threonine protein kinase